jgi:hypothetical protein
MPCKPCNSVRGIDQLPDISRAGFKIDYDKDGSRHWAIHGPSFDNPPQALAIGLGWRNAAELRDAQARWQPLPKRIGAVA